MYNYDKENGRSMFVELNNKPNEYMECIVSYRILIRNHKPLRNIAK